MNMRQKLKLLKIIDHCQDALESYRMMLSDKADLDTHFDKKDIVRFKKTFDTIDLTEEERMALFSRFAIWRNKNYNTYSEIFGRPTLSVDEFVRDCSVHLSNLKLLIRDIDKRLGWEKLFKYLQSTEKQSSDQYIAPLISNIIDHTPPVYDRISALLKFEEISTTKIPAGEISVEELSTENNSALITKLNPFRNKEQAALGNFISTLETIEKMAIELKDKKAEIDKDKLSTWLNTYCTMDDEQKDTPKVQGN